MKRLIIFLICKKLGIKIDERFRFINQKSDSEVYFFTKNRLMKINDNGDAVRSNVSLNWLLDDDCDICSVKDMITDVD